MNKTLYYSDGREKHIIQCPVCKKRTKPRIYVFDGIKVRGSRCPECGEKYYDGGDMNVVLTINKLKSKGLYGVVIKTGNSFGIRLPKPIINIMGLNKGDKVNFKFESNRLILSL